MFGVADLVWCMSSQRLATPVYDYHKIDGDQELIDEILLCLNHVDRQRARAAENRLHKHQRQRSASPSSTTRALRSIVRDIDVAPGAPGATPSWPPAPAPSLSRSKSTTLSNGVRDALRPPGPGSYDIPSTIGLQQRYTWNNMNGNAPRPRQRPASLSPSSTSKRRQHQRQKEPNSQSNRRRRSAISTHDGQLAMGYGSEPRIRRSPSLDDIEIQLDPTEFQSTTAQTLAMLPYRRPRRHSEQYSTDNEEEQRSHDVTQQRRSRQRRHSLPLSSSSSVSSHSTHTTAPRLGGGRQIYDDDDHIEEVPLARSTSMIVRPPVNPSTHTPNKISRTSNHNDDVHDDYGEDGIDQSTISDVGLQPRILAFGSSSVRPVNVGGSKPSSGASQSMSYYYPTSLTSTSARLRSAPSYSFPRRSKLQSQRKKRISPVSVEAPNGNNNAMLAMAEEPGPGSYMQNQFMSMGSGGPRYSMPTRNNYWWKRGNLTRYFSLKYLFGSMLVCPFYRDTRSRSIQSA
jgi:hypothetical protein